MVSVQSDDEQFDFYLKFAKPLVLNLPDTNDRIKAAAWIRKLKDEKDNTALRTDYLKLLLFVLQRRKLIGPFAVIPDETRPLQPFPGEINLQDVAKNFVEINKKILKEAIERGGFGEWPAYKVACSSNLKEYAVSQEIPNFGVHVYFAVSNDTLHNWEQRNKAIFPMGEKIDMPKDFGLNANISPNISSFVPPGETSLESKKDEGDGLPPDSPDRTIFAEIDSLNIDVNISPTWGSNLMKVNDTVFGEVPEEEEEEFNFDVSDGDMLDDENLDQVDSLSDSDESFYLEGDKLMSPCTGAAPSSPYKTPPLSSVSPASSLPYRTPPIPSVNLPSPAPSLPYRTPPKPGTCQGREAQSPTQFEISAEGLGGDSFIAPERKDFMWLADVSPGSGIPENVEQDSNLWESFGWWTDDPDVLFDYIPPTPRVCGAPDPYAEQRERWADVPATPPIFSTDPQIQTGLAAQRIYGIEEFGMESFEEPVWTCAEKYLKYMPESSYQDPRQVDRHSLDMTQYEKSPELKKQLFNEEEVFAGDKYLDEEQVPFDDVNISFEEADFQKMSKAQAAFEAVQYGPVCTGAQRSPPLPPPEDQIQLDEAMADVEFLAKKPPKFIFEPQFDSTPPKYDPNIDINADDLDESISKYVEDEFKIIQSNIPVTTPQRSPSPKRKKRFIGDDTPPSIQDVDLDFQNIIYSPELQTPPKYHSTPRKEINWDIEIGEPLKVSPLKQGYLGIPDAERQAKSAKKRKELLKMYQEQFASPPLAQSPERLPHLFDEPIPCNLKSPLSAKKLPPCGWTWKSPSKSNISNYMSNVIKTPTGISPLKKMSEDVTMFYESPPQNMHSPLSSPTSAIGKLQFSPPAHFYSSPGERPLFSDWQPTVEDDAIDMEEVCPCEDIIDEEHLDLYTSPEKPIENQIFEEPSTPCGTWGITQSSESPYQQQLAAQETLANIELEIDSLRKAEEVARRRINELEEADKQVMKDIKELTQVRRHTPPRNRNLFYNPNISMDYIQNIQADAREMDTKIKRAKLKEDIKERLQSQYASPPMMPCFEPTAHPFDEPIPEDAELPSALLPPSGWSWKTPPKYKLPDVKPIMKSSPKDLTSPIKMSKDVTMFYESPPHDLFSPPSPSAAISALQHTPTCGFNISSSPVRSPCSRPIIESWQNDEIADEIDLEKIFPEQFEDIYEEEQPNLYMSPPKPEGVDRITQEIDITFSQSPNNYCKQQTATTMPRIAHRPLSPATPEEAKQLWKENLKQHEFHEYGKKQWIVRPKPGKSRKIKRFTPRPVLHTIPDEREQTLPEPLTCSERAAMQKNIEKVIREAHQREKVTKEVLEDIADLSRTVQDIPPQAQNLIIYNDPTADTTYLLQQFDEMEYAFEKAKLKNEIDKRVKEQFASPPRMPKPVPIVHPFDQPLPEDLQLPSALLPPSGWSWETPPKYKKEEYIREKKHTPRAMSPVQTFSEDVSIFYESPPHELILPTSPCTQTVGIQSQSPSRSPYGIDEKISPCDCIDQEESPELYVSPTKDYSPELVQKMQQTTSECECYEENIESHTPAPPTSAIQYSPETPEYDVQLWKESLKLHQLNKDQQYPRRQWQVQTKSSKMVKVPRRARKPKLQTISDTEEPPSPKVTRQDIIKAEREMQANRRIYEEAQNQTMQDIINLQQLTQTCAAKKLPIRRSFTKEQKEKFKEDIAKRVREQFSSPPSIICPQSTIHPLDEELPPDLQLPAALLPPSGWEWKTPPHLKQQQYVARKIASPMGVSPPQQLDPESLFYESPPQIFPEDDLEATVCSPCSPARTYESPRTRSPCYSPVPHYTDGTQIYSTKFENIQEEFPPPELSRLPSPPMTQEEYKSMVEANLKDAEMAIMQAKKLKRITATCSPPTPEHTRKIWQQELASRSPLQLQQKPWIDKSGRRLGSKQPGLSPVKEKYLEWSPEMVYDPPPRITTPIRQPQMTPENWEWKTPSPQTLKLKQQRLIEDGVIPFSMNQEDLHLSADILNESPPYGLQSPLDTSPINVCSPCHSVSPSERRSPVISPYISPFRSPGRPPVAPERTQEYNDNLYFAEILPGQHEFVYDELPPENMYATVLSPSPQRMPVSPIPYLHQISSTPGTRPKIDIRSLSPERSPKHSPNRLYQSPVRPCRPEEFQSMRGQTPESAKRQYEVVGERIRFEQKRPSPKVSPASEYDTPNRTQFRGSRRRQIDREGPRKKLCFEDEPEMEDDLEQIQNLQRTMETSMLSCSARNVDAETPPRDVDICMLTDVDYEPEHFDFYDDEDAPETNIRLPFENQSHTIQNESPIPITEDIPEGERDFKWMTPCGASSRECKSKKK